MSHKRNKIILLVGVIFLLLIVLFYILKYISSDNFLIKRCEHLLQNTTKDKLIFSYNQSVCRVTGNKITRTVKKIESNDIVHPGDQIILSVNIADILEGRLNNIFTGEQIIRPQNDIYSLCFIIYPNLQSQSQYLKPDIVRKFYQDSYWYITPSNMMDFSNKGGDYICTQPLNLKQYSKISVFYTIPSQDLLKFGAANARSYGLLITFVAEKNNDLYKILNDMALNVIPSDTNGLIPIYLYLKPITFK